MDKKTLKELKDRFPKGTRVKLIEMDDKYAPKTGTLGTVEGVDDIGSLIVNWDNGSRLNVLYGIDKVEKIPTISETLKSQIIEIRDTGIVNMFDTNGVQKLANELNFYELVCFIEDNKDLYSRFILTGDIS
ncbi:MULTISPECIES: DUF4314 domain-containing protein [Helcococcus]|uniref:DUF4314 domain-containing protein n=1 Tax=Helcococcus TaxID=31983 RepID=UPI0038B7FDA9